MIDHDRLFKELLTTFFPEFVNLFLPDVTPYLKRDSLRFLNPEIFTDVTSGERYEVDYEKHALPVYPIVLFSHDSPRRPEPECYRVEFPGWTVLEFNYRVIQLNRLHWQDFVNQLNPVASALMSKMRMDTQERPTRVRRLSR